MASERTAIVIGGYGLIGSACLRALRREGYRVIGVGRSRRARLRRDPGVEWITRDVSTTTVDQWRRDLASADVVVNAAGALQDGSRDRLKLVHETAVERLVQALDGARARFIQISAAGAAEAATTKFLRSKARGDRLLMRSSVD